MIHSAQTTDEVVFSCLNGFFTCINSVVVWFHNFLLTVLASDKLFDYFVALIGECVEVES